MDNKKIYWNEKWKPFEEIVINGVKHSLKYKYQVSDLARVKKITDDGKEVFLKHTNLSKYKVVAVFITSRPKQINVYIHRLLAELFLEKPSEEHIIVGHKNYDINDNSLKNLQWFTKSEHSKYFRKSPAAIKAHRQKSNYKLNEDRVRLIKKIIFDPNRKTRMKIIAKQFGISEMQLYRIKRGENWAHVQPLD